MNFSFKNHIAEAGKWGRAVGVECQIPLPTLALGVLWLLLRRLTSPTACLQGLSIELSSNASASTLSRKQ